MLSVPLRHPKLAFRSHVARTYLANRHNEQELPCPHCQGCGQEVAGCGVVKPLLKDCRFCHGTGVDPESVRSHEPA